MSSLSRRIEQIIEHLEAERNSTQARLVWIERQIAEFMRRNEQDEREFSESEPAPNTDGKTRRTGTGRSQIKEYVATHPGCSAPDVAAALGLKLNSTATTLTQLVASGQLSKLSRGYATTDAGTESDLVRNHS